MYQMKDIGCYMDKLEQLLMDYHDGLVSVDAFSNDTTLEDKWYYRDTDRIRGKLVDYLRAPRDPLDYICEQEEKQEILKLVQKIYQELPNALTDVFHMSIICGKSNEIICESLGLSPEAFRQRYSRLQRELRKYSSEITLDSHESTLEAHAPRDFIRYACEFYKAYYEGRVNRQGNYITHCRVERYLDGAFGDDKTCCGMCEKCSNGVMRKRRES